MWNQRFKFAAITPAVHPVPLNLFLHINEITNAPLNSFFRKSLKSSRPRGSESSSPKLKVHLSTRIFVGISTLLHTQIIKEKEIHQNKWKSQWQYKLLALRWLTWACSKSSMWHRQWATGCWDNTWTGKGRGCCTWHNISPICKGKRTNKCIIMFQM